MRFVFVALIWLVILGGMLWFTDYRQQGTSGEYIQNSVVTDENDLVEMTLHITTTFSVESDPFSLQLDDSSKESDIIIRLNGELVTVYFSAFERGQSQKETLEGLKVGKNEIYVQLTPPFDESNLSNGLRLLLTNNNGLTILDETVWAEPGATISELLSFSVKKDTRGDDHDH